MTQAPRPMRITVPVLISCWLFAVAAPAQTTNETKSLTLQECIQIALEHNLSLKIERYNPLMDQLSVNAALGSYYDPTLSFSAQQQFGAQEGAYNPDLGLQGVQRKNYNENFTTGIGGYAPTGLRYDISGNVSRSSGTGFTRGFEYTDSASIRLSQPILRGFLIDQGRATIQINKQRFKRSEWTLRLQIINTITLVEQAYYDLIFARENVKVQEKALELAERLLSENKKKVEVGAMAPLDEKQAESQMAVNRANLLTARNNLDAQENVLRNLLTDDYRVWHSANIVPQGSLTAVPETFDLQDSWRKGLAQRPDLQQLKIDVTINDINARVDRNATLPDLRIVGGFGLSGLDGTFGGVLDDVNERRNPNHYYGFTLSIPIFNRAARNNYQIAKLQKEQSADRLKQLEQNVLVQIDDAVKTAQAGLERIEATRQARLYSEAALDAQKKKLDNGKATSFEVLQLQRDLTSARSEEIRALADYNKSLAQLALREGTTLERHQLNIESK